MIKIQCKVTKKTERLMGAVQRKCPSRSIPIIEAGLAVDNIRGPSFGVKSAAGSAPTRGQEGGLHLHDQRTGHDHLGVVSPFFPLRLDGDCGGLPPPGESCGYRSASAIFPCSECRLCARVHRDVLALHRSG